MIYILIIVGVMVIDRIVKISVDTGMTPGEMIPVLGEFFHITYVRNTGAAFSLLEGHTTLLIVVTGAVICFGIIFVIVKSMTYKKIFLLSVSLMCGGGLGNLTDRMAYGYVIDMFDFGRFPVFNVADIAVVTGCALLAIYMIVYENRNYDKK